MADQFNLTPQPARVTGPGSQTIELALEVSDYDEVDALAGILGVEGTTTGLSLRLLTSMQKESTDGWVPYMTFTPGNLNAANKFEVLNASTKLLKYLRWEVTGLGGATAITFSLGGMLRKRGM